MWTDKIIGKVNAKASKETGLAEGTPVCTGTIDAAAEALSVGVSKSWRYDDDVWFNYVFYIYYRFSCFRSSCLVFPLAF